MHKFLTQLANRLRKHRGLYLLIGWFVGLYQNTVMRCALLFRGFDDNTAVFSAFSFRSYNDNPRYISEALHELRPQTNIVWLFQDVERARRLYDIPSYVRVYKHTSLAGLCAIGRARVVVDNYAKKYYLQFPHKGQIYIQTWHGDRAFKKVGMDYGSRHVRMIEEHCSLGITASDYGDRQFRSAFSYKGELMKVGYPRNDILIRNDPSEAAAIRARLGLDADTRVLLYAPTFRDKNKDSKTIQKVDLDLHHVLDTLERTTGKNWKCLVRVHYLSLGLSVNTDAQRLIPASDYPEMAELLLIADALLTDYSSCAGDYAVCHRPIYLYQDDLMDYKTKNRELYFDMKDSPYWVAATQDELDALIEQTTPERASENCDAILDFYGAVETGHASQSIAEYIADKLSPTERNHA